MAKKSAKRQSKIEIKPSKRGTLRKAAKKAGAVKKDGKISRTWMEQEKKSGSPAMKKKANFALNFGKKAAKK